VLLTRREWLLGSLGLAITPHVVLAAQSAMRDAQAVSDGDVVLGKHWRKPLSYLQRLLSCNQIRQVPRGK
jgi:hypothetical protein